MNNLKQIEILGGSLTSAILASELALRGYRVLVTLDTDSLIPSWNAVRLGEQNFDNGYHGLDAIRCPSLTHLLAVDFGLGVEFDYRPSGQLLGAELRESGSTFKSMAQLQEGSFLVGDKTMPLTFSEIENRVDQDFLSFLQACSRRYSEDWGKARHMMLPWHLPNQILLNSADEGDRYRNLVRMKALPSIKLTPHRAPFEEVSQAWKETLAQFPSVEFRKRLAPKTSRPSPSSETAVSFRLTLFGMTGGRFGDFSETLIAHPDFPELARVSAHQRGSESFLLLESFHRSAQKHPDFEGWAKLLSEASGASLEVVESKITRTLHFSGAAPSGSYGLDFADNVLRVQVKSSGPVNMAKAEMMAQKILADIEVRE